MSTATRRAEEQDQRLEQYRHELTGYCYRMLGSTFDADDAVQETMVRAWRGLDRFEGRAALRSWLYRIATNVCLDMLGDRKKRARPMDITDSRTADLHNLGAPLAETTWIQPIPDEHALAPDRDPAELAEARETIRLAFVAALQHLPARQRAVLILRDVLRWRASEVAELLGGSVASVNSALQRARATLENSEPATTDVYEPLDEDQRTLLARYVDAFERYDMASLTSLLHEDATLSMPPYDLWMRGPDEIARWMTGPGFRCSGSRMLPTAANGTPAYGQYRPKEDGSGHEAWALQVLEISGGKIVAINAFLDTAELFPLFGLPLTLEA